MFKKIDIGTSNDDGTGDTLRAAFEKVNYNFEKLAELHADIAAQTADVKQTGAAEWPGDFVARHVANKEPDIVPPMLGAVWIDATKKSVFISVGTASLEDWVLIARRTD